jgi:SAM-dependent methyltransferase
MPTETTSYDLKFASAPYLGIERATRIRDELDIKLSNHSAPLLPDDKESDWVASVAAPTFKLIRSKKWSISSFATIGTGSGVDALAAIEILGVDRIGITDLHTDVVEGARANIERNLQQGVDVAIDAGGGDLLSPLLRFNPRYDLIYENLPNVTLPVDENIADERRSSDYVENRIESIPDSLRKSLVDLHFLALVQSQGFLTERGSVIATIGARVPLHVFEQMGALAGFHSTFLAYAWKTQADPEIMLRGYSQQQHEGYGPFKFYRADILRKVFADVDFAKSGNRALEIEKTLEPHRLDATAAYVAFTHGDEIGHTVAVVRSRTI